MQEKDKKTSTETPALRGLVQLINGKYTPAEARDILISLIDHKISFHQLKIFSLKERFGSTDVNSEIRIFQLREEREKTLKIIREAEEKGQLLTIESSVKLSVD